MSLNAITRKKIGCNLVSNPRLSQPSSACQPLSQWLTHTAWKESREFHPRLGQIIFRVIDFSQVPYMCIYWCLKDTVAYSSQLGWLTQLIDIWGLNHPYRPVPKVWYLFQALKLSWLMYHLSEYNVHCIMTSKGFHVHSDIAWVNS